MVLRDPEPALVLAAVSGLSRDGKTEVEGHLMGSIRGREEGQFTTYITVMLPSSSCNPEACFVVLCFL